MFGFQTWLSLRSITCVSDPAGKRLSPNTIRGQFDNNNTVKCHSSVKSFQWNVPSTINRLYYWNYCSNVHSLRSFRIKYPVMLFVDLYCYCTYRLFPILSYFIQISKSTIHITFYIIDIINSISHYEYNVSSKQTLVLQHNIIMNDESNNTCIF